MPMPIKALILVLVLGGTACDTYEHVPAPRREPRTPIRSKSIVVISRKGCAPCEQQKITLERMKPSLRGVSVKILKYEDPQVREDYPGVRSFPTVYINGNGHVGYMSEEEILAAL